jgi:peptide/nickel transport system substrate-binding protein
LSIPVTALWWLPFGRTGSQRETTEEDDDVSRRRSIKALSALAAASLIVAACGDDDDDGDAVSGDTTETSAAGTEPGGTEPGTTEPGDTEPGTTEPGTTEPGDTEPEGSAPAGAENVGVEGGSGCGIPHGPYEDDGTEPSGEVRVAFNQAPYSFNQNTNRGNATANAQPRYLMTLGAGGSGFSYYDGDLNFINNDQFGTCVIDSLDPLTVTYTINEGVTWTDGTPVDAADLIIEWAAQSGVYTDANTVVTESGVTAQADENGSAVVVGPDGADITSAQEAAYAEAFDPETGALVEGYTYKESTGVSFDTISESLQLVTQFPEISEDGRSVTATWDSFYVDYQTSGMVTGVPAHVVGQQALGIEDPMEAKAALIEAFQNNDTAAIKPISETYNTYFDATSLPDDPGVYVGYGPYNLVDFTEDGTMTFEANPDYTWGPQPHVQTIVYSIIGDPVAAVQAMENEEIDIIQPQATPDLLTQLEEIADRGIEVIQDDAALYEHVDLAVNNGGPFDPAAYGGDAEQALAVRRAFLHAVPRQDIVDRLIIPLNENATVRNAFTAVPGEPDYDEVVANNGSDEYAETDVAMSQQILEEAGIDTSTPIQVRFLTDSENPRRQSEYELIRDSVAQAGFELVNASRPDWGDQLANTSIYDATLFGWNSTAIAVASDVPQYVSDGINNFYGYSNPEVDALGAELNQTVDAARQDEILIEMEQHLFADAFGLPLFQHPQVTAYNSTYVDGVSNIAISPNVYWNVWEWTAVS